MDDLTALRLQIDWGADEAIGLAPQDRRAAPAAALAAPLTHPAAPRPAPMPDAPATPHRADVAAIATLAELRTALASFSFCALRDTATSLVAPEGEPTSGLAVIGEAPSAEDDRAGHPFSGPLGAKLVRWLASIGLERDAVLLGHLVPWRPPGGRSPSEGEVAACLPFLLRHLALARPRRVLLLGGAPTKVLTGSSDTIRRLRGKWLSIQVPGYVDLPALPMLPPDLVATPAARRMCWTDLIAVQQALDTGNQGV